MATFTFSTAPRYPVGTSVTVHEREGKVQAPTGVPVNSPVSSGTVAADSTVALTGLEDNHEYFLYGLVGSAHVWTLFLTDPPPDASGVDLTAIQADVDAAEAAAADAASAAAAASTQAVAAGSTASSAVSTANAAASTASAASTSAATANSAATSAATTANAAIPKSTGTTAGDIVAFTASATPVRHAAPAKGLIDIGDPAQANKRRHVRPLQIFNVVDEYGAVGNDSANDTTAIQAAVDACSAAGGGIVFFPPGVFRVTTIVLPMGVPITFQGSGSSAHSSRLDVAATSIRRYSGTAALITGTGVQAGGPSNLQRVLFQLYDMQLDGSADSAGTTIPAAGQLLHLDVAGNFQSRNVKFFNCLDRAVHLIHVANSAASEWYFWVCGDGAAKPALDLDSGAYANGGTHTIKFDSFEFERNQGTDMRVHGSGTDSVNWVTLVNFKHERHNVGEIYPVFDIGKSQDTVIAHGSVYCSQSDANCRMLRTTASSSASGVRCIDVLFTGATNFAGTYMVEHEFGTMHLDNCKFYVNANTTKAIRVKVGAGLDSFHPSNNQFSDNTKRIVDERVGGKTVRGGYFREIYDSVTSLTPNVGAGTMATLHTGVTLTGASAGDICRAQHSSTGMPQGLLVQARVTAANTVQVTAYNVTAGALAVPAGNVRVVCFASN